MDVSLNSIKKQNNNDINFTGIRGTYNAENIPVFKFSAPPYDFAREDAFLEIVPLRYDKEKNEMVPPKSRQIKRDTPLDKPFLLGQKDIVEGCKGFAYRYRFVDKNDPNKVRYVVDDFSKINIKDAPEGDPGEMNIIRLWGSYMIDPKTGTMTHRYVDSDSILDKDGSFKQGFDQPPRTPFNQYEGTTKGLLERIKAKEFAPYRYVMTNPDIGKDGISSHKYWPENLYQCSDLQVFKDINFELFKQGKGYVADGAFTSQSLQSPLVQHVLKWGRKSPYFNMFKIDNPNKPISLGVIPMNMYENDDDSMKNAGLRIVNNPNSKSYDKTKPTYIQFFDYRLSSEKQRENTKELIKHYDKSSDDIFEITSNEDSINPYYFELFPDAEGYDFKEKTRVFKDSDIISLKDLDDKFGLANYLDFGTYKIGRRSSAGGGTFWDGNIDMVKFNLSNPTANADGHYSESSIKGLEKARNYIWNVATYWTETVQSDLILRTAQLAKNPQNLLKLMQKNGVENPAMILNSQNRHYPVLEEGAKSIKEYIQEFPLQSLETSPDLSAIFAMPDFNRGLSLDALNTIVDGIISNAISKENRDDAGEYKKYVIKTYASEITKCVIAQALKKDALEKGALKKDALSNIGLHSFYDGKNMPSSPEEEKELVLKQINKGIKEIDEKTINEIISRVSGEIKGISLKNFKDAETVIIQSQGGLNWRFDAAKDIGDIDSIRGKTKNFKEIWEGEYGVENFWAQFIKNVKKYNPGSYVIAELTDIPDFQDWDRSKPSERNYAFDENYHDPNTKEDDFLLRINATTKSEYNNLFNKLSCFVGVNPENFNDPNGNDALVRAGNLNELRGSLTNFINSFRPNNAISAHVYFENHDKPKVLHMLPINTEMFHLGEPLIKPNGGETPYNTGLDNKAMNLEEYINSFGKTEREKLQKQITELTGGRTDYAAISPKAAAVGLMMREYILSLPESKKECNDEQYFAYSKEEKARMLSALAELVNGKKDSLSKNNQKRAHAFGSQAYEVSMKEILKRAHIKDQTQERVRDLRYNLLKPYIQMEARMWQMTNGLVGTPTMFNGMEFAQTGYESKSKNQEVKNRNAILHEDLADPRFKAIYDKYQADSGLGLQMFSPDSNQPELAATRSGFPFVCLVNSPEKESFEFEGDIGALNYLALKVASHGGFNDLKDLIEEGVEDEVLMAKYNLFDAGNVKTLRELFHEGDWQNDNLIERYIKYYQQNAANNIDVLPVVKYDDKGSFVLTVITNNGVPRGELSYKAGSNNKFKFNPNFAVDDINLATKEIEVEKGEGANKKKVKKWVNPALPDGTPLRKLVYNAKEGRYEKSPETYIVKDGKVQNTQGGKIALEETVVNFYVPTDEEIRRECIGKYPQGYAKIR